MDKVYERKKASKERTDYIRSEVEIATKKYEQAKAVKSAAEEVVTKAAEQACASSAHSQSCDSPTVKTEKKEAKTIKGIKNPKQIAIIQEIVKRQKHYKKNTSQISSSSLNSETRRRRPDKGY